MTQQHDEWVQNFASLMPHLTPFRRHMVLPCRYCHLQAVNKHTHWRNCLVVQVSCFLGLSAKVPATTHGAHGALKNFFGGVCPSLIHPVPKREREEESPEPKKARLEEAARPWPRQNPPKGKGKGKGKGGQTSWRTSSGWIQTEDHHDRRWGGPWGQDMALHDLQTTVQRLSQLTLRHEYALGNLRQDTSMCLFVKPGAEGLIPILFSASEKWNRTQEENPHLIDSSLRIVLMKAFLIELCNRLANTAKSEETMQAAKAMGWLTETGEWMLRW